MRTYSKIFLQAFLIAFLFFAQGCQLVKKEIVYPYPDSKKTIVNSLQFGALQIGMSESQVFQLTNGM
jgi:hypothetical protein